ncbi:MAG: hypothetical protein WAK62_06690, partial [Terriglobales bacterium]
SAESIYPVEKQTNSVFAFRFSATPQAMNRALRRLAKEKWSLFRDFFALPDRGRVWIVGAGRQQMEIKVRVGPVTRVQKRPNFNEKGEPI